MALRKLFLLLFLTLSSSILLEDLANAQRGGRSSGSSSRSSGSSSRSSGYSGGSSRSTSRSTPSTSRSTSPARSTSRSSYSAPRSSSSTRSSSSSSSRSASPSTSSRSSSSRDSAYSSRSTPTPEPASETPRVDLSGRDTRSRVESRYGSSSSTPSTYDLSRRTSTFGDTQARSRVGTLADATVRVSDGTSRPSQRTSSVPRLYGSGSESGAGDRASRFPAEAQHRALSERLRMAASLPSGSGADTARLAERYTPSSNEASQKLRRGSNLDGGSRTRLVREDATYPGQSRREAAARLTNSSATRAIGAARQEAGRVTGAREQRSGRISVARGQHSERIERARERRAERVVQARKKAKSPEQIAAERADWQDAQRRYQAARAQDASLQERMAAASVGVAIASDVALRTALGGTGLAGYGGVGSGSYGSGDTAADRWGGYNHGDGYGSGYGYGGWSNWYWNSCWPYYSSWWFGCSSGWFPGWSWGWGSCYGWGYNPWWSWSCYWPSYSYSYCWPTYAYWTPAVVYKYYEVEKPVYVEVEAQPEEEVYAAGAPTAAPAQVPDIGQRAAAEYMALGDRAFTEARYGDAVHYYAKAIEFAPQDGVLYLVLSDALFATGDYHYAAFALKRSLELHPELAALGLDKRAFYGTPEDFDRHLVLLEKFVEDHVIDTDARLVLAANYLFSRQPERCTGLLDNAFSVDVKSSPAGQLLMAASLEMLAKSQ